MINEKNISFGRILIIEILLACSYVFFTASWMAGSLMTGTIVAEFGLTGIPASINNAISIAKIIGNFVAAGIMMKLKPKNSVIFSILLVCCVVIGAFATNLPMFIISRFIMGFGGALLLVNMSPYVMKFFTPNQRPVVAAINMVVACIGNVVALITVNPLTEALGSWRKTILFYGMCSIVMLVLWIILGKDFEMAPKQKADGNEKTYTYGNALKEPFVYVYALSYIGLFMVYIFINYLFPLNPNFTVSARTATLIAGFGGILSVPVGIIINKKLPKGKKMNLVKLNGVMVTVTMVVLCFTKSAILAQVAAFFAGFSCYLSTPVWNTLPMSRINADPASVGIVNSVYWSLVYIMQIIIYTGLTKLVTTVSWQSSLYVVTGLSVTYLIGSFVIGNFVDKEKI